MSTDPRKPLMGEVRKEHVFDVQKLSTYLSQFDWFSGPLDSSAINQFTRGQSNPTFLIQDSKGVKFVVRKKPPGKLLKSAHQLDREYRVITALSKTEFPVPRTFCFCDDESVIGTIFYVMEFVDGRIFRDQSLPNMFAKDRSEILDELNRVAALLHSQDYKALGLSGFGKDSNDYIQRQINVWSRQYESSKTEEIQAMNNLMEWLPKNIPQQHANLISIIHGDYRLENVMFHPTQNKIVAVLDWELSTIGHPLADFAYTSLFYYSPPIYPDQLAQLEELGIPQESEWVKSYANRLGISAISPKDWRYYVAFSLFRTCGIAQGVYKRSLLGNASSPLASTYGEVAKRVANGAWQLVQLQSKL